MAKKCIPGVICIENMTLLFLIIVLGVVAYFIYTQKHVSHSREHDPQKILVLPSNPPTLAGIATRSNDSINDPYMPPLKDNGYYMQRNSSDVRGVPGIPINVETRGTGMAYQQVGILTPSVGNRGSGDNTLILPLMGRRTMTGRDKWQYYTMANGVGSLNTKLPVSVNGKSCTNEYGCDDIQNGSTVYVEGYNEVFIATIYENSTFAYIPYL